MFSKKSRRTQSSYKMFINNSSVSLQVKRDPNINLGMNYTQNPSTKINTFNQSIPSRLNNRGQSDKGKMIWGEPTWTFFHTLAEKVNEESFAIVKSDMIKYIYVICTNLPCPECAQHAGIYLNSINFNAIQTKEQLKDMLYLFHNEVNNRKGYSLLSRYDLDEKYSKNVLTTTFYNFLIRFKDKHASIRMISDDMHRARLAKQVVVWFTDAQKHFDT